MPSERGGLRSGRGAERYHPQTEANSGDHRKWLRMHALLHLQCFDKKRGGQEEMSRQKKSRTKKGGRRGEPDTSGVQLVDDVEHVERNNVTVLVGVQPFSVVLPWPRRDDGLVARFAANVIAHTPKGQQQPSAPSRLELGVERRPGRGPPRRACRCRIRVFALPPDGLFPPLPRTVSVEPSSITIGLRRCPAGEGRGEGDWCSPRFVTPSRPQAHALLHTPPHPALSHRNLRGSAERSTECTRSVPGERGRALSDILKQPDDTYSRRRTAGEPQI